MMSTVSVTPSRPGGMAGTVVIAATVSERPSGTASRARMRSAMVSLASRAMSTSLSSCRCRSRKFVPTTFQCACLPCRCNSIKSTSTACRFSNSLAGASIVLISLAFRRLPDTAVVMAGSFSQLVACGRLFRPGVVEDDVDEVVADECGVEVLEHIGVHRAEGAVRAVLHTVVEGRQDAPLEVRAGMSGGDRGNGFRGEGVAADA